jgi:hypothetical protein
VDWSDEDEKVDDWIRVNRELDSNEIDESDLRSEKHDSPRLSIWFIIEATLSLTPRNAEPFMKWTPRGISIDSSEESENANGSIPVNRELNSNLIEERDQVNANGQWRDGKYL